jgi:hypothetical protein
MIFSFLSFFIPFVVGLRSVIAVAAPRVNSPFPVPELPFSLLLACVPPIFNSQQRYFAAHPHRWSAGLYFRSKVHVSLSAPPRLDEDKHQHRQHPSSQSSVPVQALKQAQQSLARPLLCSTCI